MDERLKWIEARISSSLKPRNEDLKAMLASDENRLAFHEFIKNEDIKSLYVYIKPPRKIMASLKPPNTLHSKSIFFMKSQGAKLTRDNIGEEVTYTDCEGVLLDDIDLVTREVFLPLLCSDESQTKSSSVSADRLMDQLHRITANAEVSSGYIRGEVILPLPSVEVLAEAAATPTRRGAVLHVLESTVIGWIKQIKGLLKHEPVEDLERIYGKQPGPLDELSLWEKRQLMLHSIENQLDGPVAKDIIKNLEEAQSQYATSFQQIKRDIHKALKETNDILQFWETMKPWFVELHEAINPLDQLRLLPPIVHTLLLVWQYSRYYHQPANFSTLLRVISNEIVHRATAVIGENVMDDPTMSYSKLKDALKVCAAFRGTYLDYRDRADGINNENIKAHSDKMTHNAKGDHLFSTKLYGPYAYRPEFGLTGEQAEGSVENLATDRDLYGNSPWPQRNALCFNTLNAFMERCNDVLELVQTTRHFKLLADTAAVGGAGSQSLDALVKEINIRFHDAMMCFFDSVKNVLEIDGTQAFEKAFFAFRSVVKMLEMQLSEIIRQGFAQCPTVGSQLRLLEVFEGISSREMVQANLKEKDKMLLHGFTNELTQVKTMFEYLAKSPPLHKNMPSVVSRIQWVHALRQRILLPMEKLKKIAPQLLEGDIGWQLRDMYTECLSDFDKYENKVINKWQEKINSELTEKLKQPVMVAEDYDDETELRPQVLHVNLDPNLLLLLREIHYLSSEPFLVAVPTAARELVRNTGPYMLSVLATRLETIVSKYNTIMKMIGDYERPLFERKLARIDQLLDKGLNQLTWRSKDLNDFIEAASQLICTDVHVNLDIVQSNSREITEAALGWCKGTLDIFTARDPNSSYNMSELMSMQKEIEEHIGSDLIPSGARIHALVERSFKAVGISKASPAWEDYMDYLDAIVLNGLKQTSLASLRAMWRQLTEAPLAVITPILTIRLELIQNCITFKPPLEESTSVTSVQEVVDSWIKTFMARAEHVPMLGPKGSYIEYIAEDEEIVAMQQEIADIVYKNDQECKNLLSIFSDFSFLWELDVTETFAQFLKGHISPNPRRSTAQHSNGPSRMRQQATARSSSTSRSSSARSLVSVGIVGTAEKSFLSQSKDEEKESSVPALDEFDAEIDIYKTARDEIMGLQTKCDIGWIRVNLEPVKQVLVTHASKWMWTFTSYLAEQVTKMLMGLDTFLKRIEPEIESIKGNERDTASFMKMMRLFNEVTAQQQEMDVKFAAMHRTVLLLKKYNQMLPHNTQELFNAAPGRWNNLKTKVSLAKQRLGPRIQEESERITRDLAEFGSKVRKLEQNLDESPVFSFEYSMSEAWESLDHFSKQLSVLENEAQDLAELQDLLEANVVNFEILPKCRLTIENLKKVWEAVRILGDEQNEWKCHRWHKINTKQLRTETDRQLEMLKKLPEEVLLWDVYHGLQGSIVDIQSCLPLIDDLSNPAMRTRHWKQLVRVTGGAVQIDNDTLKRMTLGELLSLGLQTHVDDVRAIVQRAVKDLAIEKSLKTYEEVWLSKVFEMRIHIRSKSIDQADVNMNDNQSEISHTESHASQSQRQLIPRSGSRVSGQSSLSKLRRGSASSLPTSLLNLGEDNGVLSLLTNTDPIFDELERHQVSLQAMQGSSAAGSFMDEVVKWQKRLQTIEAVVSLWLEVQDKWTELEEIYSTAEIRSSLPKDAHLFDEINRDFRLLMRATEKNPNVLQCCSRKHILSILERMKAALTHCHKSLLHQLARRLQKFPRFYFLSLEDVLHIVCNGYDLRQINNYIIKLFENIGELTYTEPDESEKNLFEITGVKSVLGEHLPLKQAIVCEGQIESWLPLLLSGITSALQTQLAVVMGAEVPLEDVPKKKAIRSAGSRKIVVHSSQGSRPTSKQKPMGKLPGSRAGRKAEDKRGSEPIQEQVSAQETETKSWTLDNVTEIVYLATQLQMTQRLDEACEGLEQGDKNALVNAIVQVNTSIQESVLMLKGFETKQENLEASRAASVEKAESETGKGRGSEAKTKSETGSLAGGSQTADKKSRQGAKPGSVRGSMFDLTADQGAKSPIPEGEETGEEGLNGSPAHNDIDEPNAPEPVNTMDLGNTFNQLILKKDEEEEQVEFVEQSEIRLMLFPSQIRKIGSLIALLAYYRDLLQRLHDWAAEEHAEKLTSSYIYKSQLQYSFLPDSKAVEVKCLHLTFDYDFEYQGSADREVISPVCERVFVNLALAFKEHFGSIISGPMGSGRLETVHELSRALGRPFYWFNCHSEYDGAMLHNVFKGLAQTGSWVCFNNLNYLKPTVLSEFAKLMGLVIGALRDGKSATQFDGEELPLHSKAACMAITTNLIKVSATSPDVEPIFPTVVAQMPHDVIKQFRQFSILKPDLRLTVEAMLLAQGFTNAPSLAKKVLLAQELCVNLGGMDNMFTTTPCIGSETKAGWSLQSLKHIIVQAGTLLDKLTSDKIAAHYETIHELPEEDDDDSIIEDEPLPPLPIVPQPDVTQSKTNAESEGLAEEKQDSAPEIPSLETVKPSDEKTTPERLLADEELSIVSAIRDTFLPRMADRDRGLFSTIIVDLWPNVDIPLDFAGGDQKNGKDDPPTTAVSKASSRPPSHATVNTISKKQNKTVVPGIKESLNLNTAVVAMTANTSKRDPELKIQESVESIDDAIAVATANLGLLPGVAFQARVLQLSHLSNAHKAILVIGPSGCGKSECIKTFAVAERERGKSLSIQSVFTKAFHPKAFLGHFTQNNEWKDGLLPHILRKYCAKAPSSSQVENKAVVKVVLLDGECDPSQMEIVGSILHNDGTIVLGNNERIPMSGHVRFIWESDSLKNITPAILANVGLLVMTKEDLGWQMLLTQWLNHRPDELKILLGELAEAYIPKVIHFLAHATSPPVAGRKPKGIPNFSRCVKQSEENMVSTFCSMFEALTSAILDEVTEEVYERYFAFAVIWSFAGTLEFENQEAFSDWWRKTFEDRITWPFVGTVFDYAVDGDSKEFTNWGNIIATYNGTAHVGIPNEAFVHTVSNGQLYYLLSQLSDVGKPVMLVGGPGCGKSSIIKERIRNVSTGEVAEVLALNISANKFTDSSLMYDRLNEKLEWKHGKTFVPKGNKKLICLVDDLNLSHVDENGYQSAVELIRQHLDEGGFYSAENLQWRYVRNVTYVSTVNPQPNVSVPQLSSRLLRHFALFYCTPPSSKELERIYRTLLHTHFVTPELTATSSISASAAQHLGIKEEKKSKRSRDKQVKSTVGTEDEALRNLLTLLVGVTVQLQSKLAQMFLHTAKRCHYSFNMKDLSVVFRNLTLSLKEGCATQDLLWLWQHECDFVYGARMVNDVDRNRYDTAFRTAVRKDFHSDDHIKLLHNATKPLFSNLIEQDSGAITAGEPMPISHNSNDYHCDDYKPVWDIQSVKHLLEQAIEEYNKVYPKIHLSLYDSTVQHICRLARVISSPHEVAHLHLIGEGSPGVTSTMVKLAAHLSDFTTFQINSSLNVMNTGNQIDLFKAELVAAYTRAGVKHERILFLLHEDELFDENFLVFITEFIVSGNITHLFSPEETTTIINSIRTDVTQAGLTYTRDVAWNFFLNTVKNNFRICLVSAEGSLKFQKRCRDFPSLITCLNYTWIPHWSKNMLVDHAHYHINDIEWMPALQKENMAHMLASMHLVIRQADGKEETSGTYNNLTNTTYEKFIERYISLANRRYSEIIAQHESITTALDQIYKENDLAARLHRQLEHERIVLDERIAGTSKILAQIGQDTAITEQQVKIVKQQLEKIKKLKKLLPEYQVAHERAVFKASALAIDTKKIVDSMTMESLQELRAMQKPIIEVEDLMAAIIMILKSPTADLTWQKGAKRQMANLERFIEELNTFDDQQMAESTLVLVEPYLKKASFDPVALEKKSSNAACHGLCKWVHGVVKYHRMMISKVKPLHDKVVSTTSAVDNAEHKMATLDSKRKALEVRLKDLAKGFEDATIDKNDQEEKTIKMDRMLNTAANLRQALENETLRAEQVHKSLQTRLVCVNGAVAMAAAFCTYLGAYSHNFRRMMLTVQWPHCLRERGVPLVIDTVDHIRGRVVDFALEGLAPDMDNLDERLPLTPKGAQKVGRKRDGAISDADGESLEDEEYSAEEAEEEEETTLPEESTMVDEPVPIVAGDQSMSNTERSAPPTRQKDGQPLEPLHEVGEEDQNTEQGKSLKSESEMPPPDAIFDEPVTVSAVVTKAEYKTYISSLVRLLVGEQLQLRWIKKDFDVRQMENAAIIASAWQRPALVIDPYEEGNQFISEYSKSVLRKSLIIVKDNVMDQSGIMALEKAITHGRPALVSGLKEGLNNLVMPLIYHYNTLTEEHFQTGAPKMISYCGRRLLCHPKLKLYLSTSAAKPPLSPVLSSLSTMVNYCNDLDTLSDKLLKRAFARVRPDLFKEKLLVLRNIHTLKELMNQIIEYARRDMKEVSGGKIWNEDDVKIIEEGMKMKEEVATKLKENVELLRKLQTLQDELLPVAKRGALLYTVLRSLSSVSFHYQFKLPQFLQMYYEAVGDDPPPDVFIETEEDQEEIDEQDLLDDQRAKPTKSESIKSQSRDRAKMSSDQGNTTAEESEATAGEYNDDFEGEDATGDAAPQSQSPISDAKPGDHDISPFVQVLENLPNFPSSGLDYSPLQANQTKVLVDQLTDTVMKYTRLSLDGDHQLLFKALMCLSIQKDSENFFNDEELSLLTQGNPGLGLSLSLEDFGSDAKAPEWLPKDRWENIMAISVLPGPLDNLCVRIAENSAAWEKWYNSSVPEREMISDQPQTDDNQTESSEAGESPKPKKEDPTAEKSGEDVQDESTEKSGQKVEEMSEFHKLLVMRMLRPDRLHYALSDYLDKHMPAEATQPVAYDQVKAYVSTHNLATMILLPTANTYTHSTAKIDLDFVTLLSEAAKSRNIEFSYVTMADGCSSNLDNLLDLATKTESESWFLIDKLHLAPSSVLQVILKRLQTAVRTKVLPSLQNWSYIKDTDEPVPQLTIWITSEPFEALPGNLLESVVSISWHYVTKEFFGDGEPKASSAPLALFTDSLNRGIVSSMKLLPEKLWLKVGEQLQSIKVFTFAIAIVHGLFSSRQIVGTAGFSQWYPFCSVQMIEAVQIAISPLFSELDEQLMLENKIAYISQSVFSRVMASEADQSLALNLSNTVLRGVVFNTVGILKFGDYDIPLPPANVEPVDYYKWFEDKQSSAELSTISAIGLHTGAQKQHDRYRSVKFLEELDKLTEAQNADCIETAVLPAEVGSSDLSVNVSQLNMICLNCLERLPPMIELGNLATVSASSQYNFPYHPPSAYSDTSTAKGLMPESIGHILLQECFYMNALLCHIRQTLYDITEAIISGADGLPMRHLSAIKTLAQENVPLSWTHPDLQPSTHTLFSWLEDLNKRHAQMRVWNKSGMVPKPRLQQGKLVIDDNYQFHGRLKSVWLGGLFNPLGLLTALRHEKAILGGVLIDQVSLICEPLSLDQQNEGDLNVEGLHIQAAEWDNDTGSIVKSDSYVSQMPTICVRAVTEQEMFAKQSETGETGTEVGKEEREVSEKEQYFYYNCPIFTTKNHLKLVGHLPLKTKTDPIEWEVAYTCLLLDKGVPDNYVRRHQLIYPAKVQDLQVAQSEADTADYLTRLNTALQSTVAGSKQQQTTKMPTPPSQLSYKALTPKAAPLPPSLALTRHGGHGRSDIQAAKSTDSGANSRRASRASVFKSINADGKISRLSTPVSVSDQQNSDSLSTTRRKASMAQKGTPRGSRSSIPAQTGSKTSSKKNSRSSSANQSPALNSPATGQSPKLANSPKASPKGTPSPAGNSSPATAQVKDNETASLSKNETGESTEAQ